MTIAVKVGQKETVLQDVDKLGHDKQVIGLIISKI